MKLKCYRVWFEDDTAVLLDGESEQAVRLAIEQGIEDGKYYGNIKNVECLTDEHHSI